MQLLKSLTLAALLGYVFQMQGCDAAATVAPGSSSTTTGTTTAAASGNSTRRLEFDFTFNAAEDVHV
jgi:hypothetical protein